MRLLCGLQCCFFLCITGLLLSLASHVIYLGRALDPLRLPWSFHRHIVCAKVVIMMLVNIPCIDTRIKKILMGSSSVWGSLHSTILMIECHLMSSCWPLPCEAVLDGNPV